MKRDMKIGKLLMYLLLIVASFISVFPFYWMFVMATNPSAAYNSIPPALLPGSRLVENFQSVLEKTPFFGAMWNSFVVCLVVTAGVLFISALAGFAFAKFNFKGKNVLFLLILLSMVIPPQLGLIPQYYLVAKFGMLDTLTGAMIVFFLNPLGIFLMRQYIGRSVPDELIESAKIDGCSNIRIFFNIVVPIILPAFATLGIIVFTATWGEFLWQFTVLRDPAVYTIQVALSSLNTTSNIDFGMLLSGVFWATVPLIIVFLIFNKFFISSITEGSIK